MKSYDWLLDWLRLTGGSRVDVSRVGIVGLLFYYDESFGIARGRSGVGVSSYEVRCAFAPLAWVRHSAAAGRQQRNCGCDRASSWVVARFLLVLDCSRHSQSISQSINHLLLKCRKANKRAGEQAAALKISENKFLKTYFKIFKNKIQIHNTQPIDTNYTRYREKHQSNW